MNDKEIQKDDLQFEHPAEKDLSERNFERINDPRDTPSDIIQEPTQPETVLPHAVNDLINEEQAMSRTVTEQHVVTETPSEEVKFVRTKLELLPPKIKKELDDLIKTGIGPGKVKAALEDRYGPKDTDFLPTSEGTYHKYIQMHREELMKQAELEKGLIDTTKESLQDTKNFMDVALGNASLENKKLALENLYRQIERRIRLLETSQSTGFMNAQIESVMGAYIREQRTIIESTIQLREELERDASAQMYTQFENLTYAWLVTVLNVYKKVNGEEKLLEFKNILKEELPKILDAYKPDK